MSHLHSRQFWNFLYNIVARLSITTLQSFGFFLENIATFVSNSTSYAVKNRYLPSQTACQISSLLHQSENIHKIRTNQRQKLARKLARFPRILHSDWLEKVLFNSTFEVQHFERVEGIRPCTEILVLELNFKGKHTSCHSFLALK